MRDTSNLGSVGAARPRDTTKLRIGYVCLDDVTSVATWSGTPSSILNKMKKKKNITIEIVGPLRTAIKYYYLPFIGICKIFNSQYAWNRTAISLKYFARQVEKICSTQRFDVLFANSSIPLCSVRLGIPVVFWTDALIQDLSGYYSFNIANIKQSRLQEIKSIQRACFACYSSNWSASSAALYADAEKIKVLHYGPNIEISHSLKDVAEWISQRSERQNRLCKLLFVGKEWHRKGGDVAVETARLLNKNGINTRLTLVGSRPTGKLPHYVDAYEFIDKSSALGKEAISDLFRTSDIFVLPSRAEASAIVLAEAAAFGLPVLTCETGGLSDYVTNGVNGYRLPVEDSGEGFAEKVNVILADYKQYAMCAYDEYRTKLNYEISVDKLINLLKLAAHKRGAGTW